MKGAPLDFLIPARFSRAKITGFCRLPMPPAVPSFWFWGAPRSCCPVGCGDFFLVFWGELTLVSIERLNRMCHFPPSNCTFAASCHGALSFPRMPL